VSQRRGSPRANARTTSGEKPAGLHPLLSFQFDSDARGEPKGGRRKLPEPTSIGEALSRWLDEQL